LPAMVFSVIVPLAAMTFVRDARADSPDPKGPTAIEHALIDRACSAVVSDDARRRCVGDRLLSLRADFGRDLNRLSVADRKNIDAACTPVHTVERREAYLDCLSAQLTALHNRRNRAKVAVAQDAPSVSPPVTALSAAPTPPSREQSSWWSPANLIGVSVAVVLAAAGVAFLAVRSRRSRPTCRTCGIEMSESGDLCSKCRRQAAQVLRRAAAERAHQQNAPHEEAYRQRAHEAERHEQRAREEEDARMRQQALARQREELARQREEARRQEEEARVQGAEVFDPYAILGVAPDTSPDEIRAAYEQAKLKYDLDFVADMGIETQRHFEAKSQAVDRAYRMLAQTG